MIALLLASPAAAQSQYVTPDGVARNITVLVDPATGLPYVGGSTCPPVTRTLSAVGEKVTLACPEAANYLITFQSPGTPLTVTWYEEPTN